MSPARPWLPFRGGHAGCVENQSARRESRRHEIGDRIAAIRIRIDELRRPLEHRILADSSGKLIEAQQHAANSESSAQQALASSIHGLLQAAEAHERCAISRERLAAGPYSNEEEHRQQASHHRAAAAADRQRAESAQSLLSSRAEIGQQRRERQDP